MVDAPLTLHWLAFEAHFPNEAVTMSLSLLPIKAAKMLIMDNSKQIASHLASLQDHESLTLCWRSFSEWGCYHVAFSFASKGCQYIGYGYQWANRYPISLLRTPKIVHSSLTLIVWMGLLLCRCHFCL